MSAIYQSFFLDKNNKFVIKNNPISINKFIINDTNSETNCEIFLDNNKLDNNNLEKINLGKVKLMKINLQEHLVLRENLEFEVGNTTFKILETIGPNTSYNDHILRFKCIQDEPKTFSLISSFGFFRLDDSALINISQTSSSIDSPIIYFNDSIEKFVLIPGSNAGINDYISVIIRNKGDKISKIEGHLTIILK